jgi:hypothetical protein
MKLTETQKNIRKLKMKYPKGTKIVLNSLNDKAFYKTPGSTGTVSGHMFNLLLMSWDDATTAIGLIPDVDDFDVLK